MPCCPAFKALLELGAELRELSAIGWPPLFYAVENRRVPFEVLLTMQWLY